MQKLHELTPDPADMRGMQADQTKPSRHRKPPLRSGAAIVLVAALTGCTGMQETRERNLAFWNSPQGQALMAQTLLQQQALNQQGYQFEQARMLQRQQMHMDMARSMQPVRLQHSGTIDIRHSGAIGVRR